MTGQDDKVPRKPSASLAKAIGSLTETIEQIFADGKITPEGRKDFYKAIESILPTRKKEETDKNKRIAKFDFVINGIACREDYLRQKAEEYDFVLVGRNADKENHKVEVRLKHGMYLGVVPVSYRTVSTGPDILPLASEIIRLFDEGYRYRAYIKKILYPKVDDDYSLGFPSVVVIVEFYGPEANVQGIGSEVIFSDPRL